MNQENLILRKLEEIKLEINNIKEHLEDINLTEEDIQAIEEARRDFRERKTRKL